jgi:chromosome segregation ATPase
MKNFQQNLFIVLALALCGLCAWQWHGQTLQRDAIGTLNGLVYDRDVTIRDATNSLAVLNHQLVQMDASLTAVKANAATNAQSVASQKIEIARLRADNLGLTNEITQYQQAVDTLETKLKDAYAGLEKQNGAITNLIAQRDDLAVRFNSEVKDRNDIVAKYNELVNQIQKQGNSPKP